ncbi:hypothetical protein TWF694_001736 [Orbilia ellipsospora]|uniref:F-box domain-containing protein n=1 Tax=Orbilia ellipsospora TaxID=2528407 RepID=A0AAV9X3P2_9PEZI
MNSPPTLTTLLLIPPILDCIVTYLPTTDLTSWSATSHAARRNLLLSHAAWRAISFSSPRRPQRHLNNISTSIFDSTIVVRNHNGSNSPSPPPTNPSTNAHTNNNNNPTVHHGNGGNNEAQRYLSIDTTLTVLARMLPLKLYTSLDLTRTMADKHLLRDLLDNCTGLKYLVLEECPRLRVPDIVVAFYGIEKRVLKGGFTQTHTHAHDSSEDGDEDGWKRRRRKDMDGGGGGGVSLVAEVMGRKRRDENINSSNSGGGDIVIGGGGGMMLSRLKHVHTKEVRDGLYRLNELKDGVRSEIVRCMSRMEDVYTYPDMPGKLDIGKGLLELREVRTDLKLHRSAYNGPGWLERLAYSQGDYLFLLCHLLGVTLISAD